MDLEALNSSMHEYMVKYSASQRRNTFCAYIKQDLQQGSSNEPQDVKK